MLLAPGLSTATNKIDFRNCSKEKHHARDSFMDENASLFQFWIGRDPAPAPAAVHVLKMKNTLPH